MSAKSQLLPLAQFQLLRPEDVCGAVLIPFSLEVRFSLFRQKLQGGWERVVLEDEFAQILADQSEKENAFEQAQEELHHQKYAIGQLDQSYLDQVKFVRIECDHEMKGVPDAAQFRQTLARLRNVERVEFSGGDNFYVVDHDSAKRMKAWRDELALRFAYWFKFLRDVVPAIWPLANEFGWWIHNSSRHFVYTSRALRRTCLIRICFAFPSDDVFNGWERVCKHLAGHRRRYKRLRFVLWGLPVQSSSEGAEPAPFSYFAPWHRYLRDWVRLAPMIKLQFEESFGIWLAEETQRVQTFLYHHSEDVRQVIIANVGHTREIDLTPLKHLQTCEVEEFEMTTAEKTSVQLPPSLVALYVQQFFAVKGRAEGLARKLQAKMPNLDSMLIFNTDQESFRRPDRKQRRELVIQQQLDTLASDALPLFGASVLPLVSFITRLASVPLVSRTGEDP